MQDQQLIVYDQEWLFKIIERILSNKTKSASSTYNQQTNMSSIKCETFKTPAFMDEYQIANVKQVEFILQIIISLNFLLKIETESDNLLIIPNYFKFQQETPLVCFIMFILLMTSKKIKAYKKRIVYGRLNWKPAFRFLCFTSLFLIYQQPCSIKY